MTNRGKKNPSELIRRYKKRIRRNQNNNYFDLNSLRIAFSKFDKLMLLSKISALNLLPQNQGRTVRLEFAQRMALVAEDGYNQIDSLKLTSILSNYLPNNGFYAMQEDPVDNLFTENLVFHCGNYVLYPGITESGVYILQSILSAIFRTKNNLPDTFKNYIYLTSLLLLNLSNNIAQKLKHQRNIEPPATEGKTIFIPSNNKLDELSMNCIFTATEIKAIYQRFDVDETYLQPFLLSFSDKGLSQNPWYDNPIHAKPFCKIKDNIVLLQPSCIAGVLRHFIIIKAIKDNLADKLFNCLKEATVNTVVKNLDRLGFSNINFQLPESNGKINFLDEIVFKFDLNKLCYVQLLTDDLTDYQYETVYGHITSDNLGEKLQKRQDEINEILLNDSNLKCEKILNLAVMSGIGRSRAIGFDKGRENTFLISLTDEELDIAIKTEDCDRLTFWKFARSYNRFLDIHPDSFRFNSFLDIYNLYLKHHNSFTIRDDNFSMVHLEIGGGNELRIKVKNSLDTHAARFKNILNTVHKRYSEGNIPIYFSEDYHCSYRLVEGYDIPIWIMPQNNDYTNIEYLSIYLSFSEMFAYWIWQMTPSLEKYINNLPFDLLNIYFDFDNIAKWSDHKIYNQSDADLTYKISGNSIYLNIPLKYKEILGKSDNEGEKAILIKLMEAINSLFKELNLKNPFDEIEINNIVDSYTDNKFKKMILLNIVIKASLNPENIPELRLLQKNDDDDQLEGLANLLVKNKLPVGLIPKTKRLDVLREVVEIYHNRLKKELLKYNYKDLLPFLISYQESICHKRAQDYLHWPAQLACFYEEKEFIEKETEKMCEINATSNGLRFLIEFISAEPPQGNAKLSLDDYDRLVAVSCNFINWATLYDQIENELFESELDILPNGRIGRDRGYMVQFKNDYISKKIQEKIDISCEVFGELFREEVDNRAETDSRIDNALIDEFGMKWDDIINFHSTLTKIGFQKKVSCVIIRYNEFLKDLERELNWDNEKIKLSIDNFSLTQRQEWEKPPVGYDFIKDVAPWRFKRRLSYVLRCLVQIGQNNEEKLFFWGPRHVEESLKYLAELIGRGQYPSKSGKMLAFSGEMQKEIGDRFNNRVYDWFKENSYFIVKKNINISSFIRTEQNFGDIDILLVDEQNNKIYSFECKYLYPARNAREMASELERLLDDSEDKSWMTKHLERHKIINDNLPELLDFLNIQKDNYKLYSAVLTSEEIPSVYLSKMPLAFINLMSLKRDGLRILEEFIHWQTEGLNNTKSDPDDSRPRFHEGDIPARE